MIIDGFRGTVSDIGLKSTKITDAGGNIKAINNSSITTVVNLSRMDSLVTVSMAASYNEDPVRVEGLLLRALPKIQAKIPQITDTLTYKGISEIGDSDVSYLVICHCKEANRFRVTRDLNREVLLLFIQNDIQFVYPQITVNQPDPVYRSMAALLASKMCDDGLLQEGDFKISRRCTLDVSDDKLDMLVQMKDWNPEYQKEALFFQPM